MEMWADLNGEYILIGGDDSKHGDPVIVVPLGQDEILAWISALLKMLDDGTVVNLVNPQIIDRAVTLKMLDDGTVVNLPGDWGKCDYESR
jgi:hypothetical protein